MPSVPTYALYGEQDDALGADVLHLESIPSRSSRHGFRIEPHRHEALFQLVHLSRGRATATLGERRVELDAPAVVTVPQLLAHGYVFSPDVDGTVLTLLSRDLPRLAAPSGFLREVRIVPLPAGDEPVSTRLAELAGEWEGRAPQRRDALLALASLTLIAVHRAGLAGPAGDDVGEDRATRHVARFRELIDAAPDGRRPVADYARRIGITPTHLNRICRQVLGRTAQEVIMGRVLREAARGLVFTNKSVKEVAADVGFDDAAYFTRLFRKKMGVSPTGFRLSARVPEGPDGGG